MQKLVNLLFEVGTLRKIARSHRQRLLTEEFSDNIASHSHRVSIIGWFLAITEKADPYKVLAMCVFHDVSETRSGDINWVHKRYVKVFEDEIISDQLKDIKNTVQLKKLFKEYSVRKTLESRLAKDADVLDQLLLCKEYAHSGNEIAKRWINSQEKWENRLSTSIAKKLVSVILDTSPDAWAEGVSTPVRRK